MDQQDKSAQGKAPAHSDRLGRLLGQTAPRRYNKSYSRVVRTLRVILPLVAAGIIMILMAWPRLEDVREALPPDDVLPPTIAKNELLSPRFESTDNKRQPFTILASRALQSAQDPDVVLLEAPQADITLNDGTWLAARSDKGAYRQESETLLLEGDVRLFHDHGYELTTQKLLINLKQNRAWSDLAIHTQGPAGTLDATGLQADGETGILIFTGPARLILNQSLEGL